MALLALASRAAGQLGLRTALGAAAVAWRAVSTCPPAGSPAKPPSGAARLSSQASSACEESRDATGVGTAPRYKAVTVDLFGTLLSEAIGEAQVGAGHTTGNGTPAACLSGLWRVQRLMIWVHDRAGALCLAVLMRCGRCTR